jgi:hypothetical protein
VCVGKNEIDADTAELLQARVRGPILQTGSPISSRFFGVISPAINCVRIR